MEKNRIVIRNNGIDILKFICSFMVVYIHAPIFRDNVEVTIPIVQIEVPCFFMITGYYYISLEERGKVKSQLYKLLMLTFLSTIFYIGVNLCWQRNPLEYLKDSMTIENLIRFVCFNNMPIAEIHLWYLYAVIYVLVIVCICRKYEWDKYLYISVPVLFIANISINELAPLTGVDSIPGVFGGNFFVTGIPFFGIGMLIYKNKAYIQKNTLKRNVIIMLICTILFHMEYCLLIYKNTGTTSCFMKIPLAIIVFILFEFNLNKGSALLSVFASIGRKYSLSIYILHLFVIRVLHSAPFEIPYLHSALRPIIVYALTLVLSAILVKVKSLIKIKHSKQCAT